MRPNCFYTQETYDDYCRYGTGLRVSVPGSEFTHDYCRDCLPEFKIECVAANRCDHPETFFVLRKDPANEYSVIGMSYDSMYRQQDITNHKKAVARHKRLRVVAVDSGTIVKG